MKIASQEIIAHPPRTESRLLRPGRNCWRIEHAKRFGMLVDADAYFRAVRAAMCNARHSIFILSWDIDSRTRLVPQGVDDGYPEQLGDFLRTMVNSRPQLHVHILNWDFAMLYALEREWLPEYKLGWHTHRRLAFHMDGQHPIGASHHQKVVVIDDAVAFVGGLDLTRCRWDTPEHRASSPLRCDTEGKPHEPFHDVQAIVDGKVARALGELARTRWERATHCKPIGCVEAMHDPWPAHVIPDVTDVEVAIARTEPAFDDHPEVDEIRQLHLDAIASAQRHLFFENQYFTAGLIGNALAKRLAEPDGPEVAVVSPQTQSGWLEDATMGVLRTRLHRRLKQADRYDRYRLYCPLVPGLEHGCLNVHSKVFAVDGDLFSIGSANLSNRSMASDTECNLVIEAHGTDAEKDRIRQVIARLRNRLLAEHLGTSPEEVGAELDRHGGLHRAIEALQQPGRTLQGMDPPVLPELDALIPDQAIFDPERPIDPDELVAQLVPKEARRPIPWRLVGLGLLAVMLAALAIAWRSTPLREYVNLASLLDVARGLEALPFTPLAVVASYVIGGLLMVPVTLLIAVTGIVFGPVEGAIYAIFGTLLSAAVTYGIGHWLGRDTVRRLLGARVNRLSRRIAKRGILAMVIVRMLPIAPFTVVNIVSGASHLSFRDFMLGTLLGISPGIVITVTFVHNLAEAIRNPSAGTVAMLAGIAALLIGFALLLQRLFAAKKNQEVH
jgi:phospholipase D1/2